MQSLRLLLSRFAPARRRALASLCAGAALLASTSLQAQLPGRKGFYEPLDQNAPTGRSARWTSFKDPGGMPWFQPVRFDLPTTGKVSFLSPRGQTAPEPAPTQAALLVGHTYRFKITDMPEFPGAELYPSVEVLDRLHPPPGKEHEFPVFLELTRDDIDLALGGQLVTKVIYLEQPSLAKPIQQTHPIDVQVVAPSVNLLTEADNVGRPMLLIRIGGRIPDVHNPDPAFYGTGAPIIPSPLKVRKDPPPKPPQPATAPAEDSTSDTSNPRGGLQRTSATDEAGSVVLGDFTSSKKPAPKATNMLRDGGWSNTGRVRR